jgi:hypothetical protein
LSLDGQGWAGYVGFHASFHARTDKAQVQPVGRAELNVTIPLFLMFASAAVMFAVTSLVAIVYYFCTRKQYDKRAD